MEFGKNFPVAEYYRDHIVDAVTIANTGSWWTACLLIKDPKSEKRFIGIYRWQKVGGVWKRRSNYNLRSSKEADSLMEAVKELVVKL